MLCYINTHTHKEYFQEKDTFAMYIASYLSSLDKKLTLRVLKFPIQTLNDSVVKSSHWPIKFDAFIY